MDKHIKFLHLGDYMTDETCDYRKLSYEISKEISNVIVKKFANELEKNILNKKFSNVQENILGAGVIPFTLVMINDYFLRSICYLTNKEIAIDAINILKDHLTELADKLGGE